MLAVAVHVARRDGLPLPRALAIRYLGAPEAEESEWQKFVTDHLDVPLEVITVPPGGNEIVSPLAISRLLRDGPIFPPPASVSLARIAPAVAGTTVLTGEGGDDILGAERISFWLGYLRARRIPRSPDAREMVEDLTFGALRRSVIARRINALVLTLAPWLRPHARRVVSAKWVDEVCATPFDWRRATWQYLNFRRCLSYETMAAVAAREGFRLEHPLMDPDFVATLCRRGGATGFPNRSHIMRLLAADLLPDSVSRRQTKATFNEVYVGDGVRSFARSWSGKGLDESLVDVEALRAAWSSDMIPGPSLAPLQYALLDALESGWEPTPVAELLT